MRKITNKSDFELKAFKNPNTNKVQAWALRLMMTRASTTWTYARIAEAFIYDSVSTTASEPEHRVSYINIVSENDSEPEYDDMSIVGLNIRSSKELRNLDQLSVYVDRGVIDSATCSQTFSKTC